MLFIFCTHSIWFSALSASVTPSFSASSFTKPREHFLCLPINVGKITVQLAACQQNVVTYPVILLQIPQMPLSQYADIRRSFFGQFQAGKIVITLQFMPKPVFLVINVLVHFCNPPIMIDFTYNPIIPADYKSRMESTSLRILSLMKLVFILLNY